jgi:hypothetical protein
LTDNSVNAVPSVQSKQSRQSEGLPMWMPLLGLLIAFAFALFVGARICPTLSGIVLPPSPPLPSGGATLLKHEGKGVGLDEWLYGTDQTGCAVAQYYERRFGACIYDPDASCQRGGAAPLQPGVGMHVAQCTGSDTFGAYQVTWTVYISSGYAEQGKTHFRVFREVGN